MSAASILVAESDAGFRTAICRALRTGGYTVGEACDGAQALYALRTRTSDLLITDIVMPSLDGFELISAAKREYGSLQIIAMSSPGRIAGLDLLGVAMTLGANETLAKPFTTHQLFEAVERLVGRPDQRVRLVSR
jgi:CheY-like chemotaxis protein